MQDTREEMGVGAKRELLDSYEKISKRLWHEKVRQFNGLFEGYAVARKTAVEQGRTSAPFFNPFETLGLAKKELIHSKVIAWLFDPLASHSQGGLFFRKFNEYFELGVNFAPGDYSVKVEHTGQESTIDIMVYGKSFLIFIENKVGSTEGQLQTFREYEDLKTLADRFDIKGKIFAFYLSPQGNPPADRNWRAISYEDLARAMEKALVEVEAENVVLFVRSWLDLVKTLRRRI